MDIKSINAKFESVKASYNIEYEAKVEQLQVVLSVLKGRNVLALLPTGFGKTLCVAIPTMLSEDKDCITIVISPLTSLIDDQICRLNKLNVRCAKITGIGEMEKQTITDSLGKTAYVDGIVDGNQVLVKMYHKSTHQDSKDRIINEFKTESSRIRCIIATVALGMGLDISDIDLVVHSGCPKTVLSY
ncbi:Hypothetical predicted protein [Mytilus galloprovincialis]|uniref:DNA 3'-5' helicase n=1 Tax=Mytilus galloprovincialis TaxID=29158 RepID=A0A8B6EBK8_MYTGA|nr:Hypothetical predicted protein [Mytilus galloprovincialis]